MAQQVREIMTERPAVVGSGAPLTEAAQLMRERDIGNVLVADNGKLQGVLTDRDIVVRLVAEGTDPRSVVVGDVCSRDPICVGPQEDADQVLQLMRTRAVRRVPVVDGDRLVGVVSLGDMAIERDARSVLADISGAEPNN
jgi:CBS domain-containing protein